MSPAGRVLADAAALVEGKVLTVSFSYDEESGPRTNFEFQVDRVHEGSVPTERLTLSVLSGFLPSGQFMTATDTPAFSEGQRCLLLLTAKSAFWSSIVPGYAFTIETFDGNDVVIGEEGHALVSIGVTGARFGTEKVVRPSSFDGTKFEPPTRLAALSERALGVADAVDQIRAIAKQDRLSLRGGLGSTKPDWSPWNKIPAAGVGQ
jgi:hypothetical protein